MFRTLLRGTFLQKTATGHCLLGTLVETWNALADDASAATSEHLGCVRVSCITQAYLARDLKQDMRQVPHDARALKLSS